MTDETTILVVDDQAQNIRLLDAVLSPRGYRVVSADSGEQALDLLSEEQPHLVLLDILMPGMDGYEVCRRIRANPDTAYLPVVMITASDAQQKVRGIESGADDFITKPFDQAELLARVKSLVRVKRYQDTITGQAAELAGMEPPAGTAGRVAIGRAREGDPPPSIPSTADGRADPRLRRRVVPGEPSSRDRGGVLRSTRLHPIRRVQ